MRQMRFDEMEEADGYREFEEKFKPRKTTDECHTPPAVYEAVADWVAGEYGVARDDMVRPFWPGGDYERFDYPDGCCVVDNPPFSILSRIVRFYNDVGIRYFLFAPALTNFQARGCCHVIADADVTYENGAVVRTAFLTNLDGCIALVPHGLSDAIKEAQAVPDAPRLPKYEYPDHVLTAAMMMRYARYGIPYRLEAGEGTRIGALDAQRAAGKSVFGDGFLLSTKAAAEKAAAEKAAAEKAAAVVWELSERERGIVRMMDEGRGGGA